MQDLKKKLENYINKIKAVEVELRNKVQIQFLEETAKKEWDKNRLLDFLKMENLFENIELTEKEKKSIKTIRTEIENTINPGSDILYYRTELENHKIEMYLKKPKGYTIPVEIFEFIGNVEEMQTVIKETCKSQEEADKFLEPLFGIAEVGGTSTYNVFAKKQLEMFKENFVASKWWSLKLPFIKDLAVTMVSVVLICFFIIFLIKMKLVSDAFYDHLNIDKNFMVNWLLLLIGSSIGTWVSFSLFKKSKTLEEIKSLKDNIPHPFFRLAVVGLVASVFFLFFITGFFNVEIGSGEILNTKYIGKEDHGNLALLVGIFIGFSENSIGQSLRKRIESFTSKL